MKNNFKVKVDSKWELDVSNEEILSLDIVKLNDNKYHLLKNHQSYQGEIVESNFNNRAYAVKVNGSTYNVSIENQLDQLIKNMGFSKGSSKDVKLIKAPMPGVVLSVHVKVGQEVSEDESLLVLEAMKMESSLVSPSSGVVKNILVANGNTVEKGQLLIEFE